MTKEKERFDKANALYQAACDKYETDIEKWEAKIYPFLMSQFKAAKPDFSHYERNFRYRSDESYSLGASVSYTRDELKQLIGGYPEQPESVEPPAFMRERYGYKYNSPSVYQAVYQAIQLLSMSDDEHVNASTYQLALEVL